MFSSRLAIPLIALQILGTSCLKSRNHSTFFEEVVTTPVEPVSPEKVDVPPISKACIDAGEKTSAANTFKVLLETFQAKNCSELSNFSDIEILDLRAKGITDIQPLAHFPKLRHLDLSDNFDISLTQLRNIPSLESLRLDGTGIENLDDMPPLATLRYLSLAHNRVKGRLQLPAFPLLEELDLSFLNGINEIDLSDPQKLRILRLNSNPLAKLSDLLSKTTSLREVYLQKVLLENLDGLKPLLFLERLDFNDNAVRDIRALSDLKKLTHIWGDQNQIISLEPLRGLESLEVLHLANNLVADEEPLKGLKLLWDIELSGNPSRGSGSDLEE